jgi:transaldolase
MRPTSADRAAGRGRRRPLPVASVASYFVSRVDTEADKRLERRRPDELQGKLAVANAKLAYQSWKEVFAAERWEALEAKGASKQWCLWASTSTKNPRTATCSTSRT